MTLTHLDEAGAARMVDIAGKPVTAREAVAAGRIAMSPDALALVRDASARKGDVLAVARIAGIMAAKRTADLIPLCHPLPLTRVAVDLQVTDTGVEVTTTAATEGRTGVEMEALTAATVALLTIYDMVKAADKGMVIEHVRLLSKTGGKSQFPLPSGASGRSCSQHDLNSAGRCLPDAGGSRAAAEG